LILAVPSKDVYTLLKLAMMVMSAPLIPANLHVAVFTLQ
jgi:hypothetical protein